MKNFPIIDKETGREYWISRSVAVLVIPMVYSEEDNERYIIVTQRGKGTPDPKFVGKYCLPCGYLDFDETTKEAAARELFEETGIERDLKFFTLVGINDEPSSDKRQNITFRYKLDIIVSRIDMLEEEFTTEYSEKDEVSSIKLININNIDMYEWAFNHDKLLEKYI